MAKNAQPPVTITHVDEAGKEAYFSSNAIVRWTSKRLTCTCVTAVKCQDKNKMICNHILHVYKEKIDRITVSAVGFTSMYLLVANKTREMPGGVWTAVQIGEPDDDDIREITWNLNTSGYISSGSLAAMSRRDLVAFLFPEMLNYAIMVQKCSKCFMPEALLIDKNATPAQQLSAIREMLYIDQHDGYCVGCDESAAIPKL